jgi:hypothetical protein
MTRECKPNATEASGFSPINGVIDGAAPDRERRVDADRNFHVAPPRAREVSSPSNRMTDAIFA